MSHQSLPPEFEQFESQIYDEILNFYEKQSRGAAETDIWQGFEYTKLMQLYREDPARVQEIIRNSILIILGLFDGKAIEPRGVDLNDFPPSELDEILEDLESIVRDMRESNSHRS